MKKKKYVILCLVVLIVGYLKVTAMPLYSNRFTIDINNMTPKSIDGMIMRYTYDQKCVVIPKIAPFERVIVIAPSDIYDKTKIFHISSITLAISKTLRETALEMIKRFKAAGAMISFDVNYRAALWSEDEAREVIEKVFPYVDLLFVSEETSRRMLRRTGTLEEIMQGYAERYGCRLVATTQRHAVTPNRHNFTSKIYCDGAFYEEEPYNGIEVIDRIGSGDAYLAGVMYGLITHGDVRRALEIGNALSAVKCTVSGDMSASSIDEIESVIKSHKSTGVQDEMVR